jgi:hypothetical protein
VRCVYGILPINADGLCVGLAECIAVRIAEKG